MRIRKGALFTMDLGEFIGEKKQLVSRVHVVNGGAREKEIVDPDKEPIIVLTRLYLDLVTSRKYDLVRLGRCYDKVFWSIIVDNIREVRAPLIKCLNEEKA